MRCACEEIIASPTISLDIHFPQDAGQLTAKAKLIWRRDLEGGGSVYGLEFTGLNAAKKEALRKELVRSQIKELLGRLKDAETRENISRFFLKDILDYINAVLALIAKAKKIKGYSPDIEARLEHANNKILLKGYALELLLADDRIREIVKENFRQLTGTWIYTSAIVKKAFTKSGLYPLDHEMLEAIYENKPISKGVGRYFDKSFLKSSYSVALRKRKDRLKEIIVDFVHERRFGEIKIASIACSSCREIREILPDLHLRSPVAITCLDQEAVLDFCRKALSAEAPRNVKFRFLKADLMHIAGDKDIPALPCRQDLIYSMGLANYLPELSLKRLVTALYGLLADGGKLILTHKNREKTFPTILPDWFCGLKSYNRSKDEFSDLIYDCGVPRLSLSSKSDSFGYICYFILTKQPGI
jgi:hypothetical protein